MGEELEQLIKTDPRYRSLIKAVVGYPYVERQTLSEIAGIPHEDLEHLLHILTEKFVLLELASQADSSVESRVPKKVYLVNPEIEQEIRKLL